MCGRFSLSVPISDLAELFGFNIDDLLAPRFNIAPTQPVAVVRNNEAGRREFTLLHWGLIPSWSKDPGISAKLTNARSETVTEKPSFRHAFRRRRCLLPTSGFYEWQRKEKKKVPYYIRMKDGRPFAMGGLWERWQSPEGSELESCAILTTGPNDLMRPIHDRMPVILAKEHFDRWLDTPEREADALKELFAPFDPDKMVATPVGTYVNNARNEGPACQAEPPKDSLFDL